jgi:hypothetical protein
LILNLGFVIFHPGPHSNWINGKCHFDLIAKCWQDSEASISILSCQTYRHANLLQYRMIDR